MPLPGSDTMNSSMKPNERNDIGKMTVNHIMKCDIFLTDKYSMVQLYEGPFKAVLVSHPVMFKYAMYKILLFFLVFFSFLSGWGKSN